MSNYLGIDYGLKHLGLATAETTLATPLMSITNDTTIISRLTSIISREGITHVVCGIPEGKLAPIITQFAAKLEQACGIPVVLHPETLSTQEAISLLHEGGAKRAKIQNDHVYAACLILEDYLDLNPVLY
jgi:putative transcription antitermination factor YqgF